MTQPPQPQPSPRPGGPQQSMIKGWWIITALVLAWLAFPLLMGDRAAVSIPYTTFLSEVDEGNVDRVLIRGDRITGTLSETTSLDVGPGQESVEVTEFSTVFPAEVGEEGLIERLRSQGAVVDVESADPSILQSLIVNFLPFVIIGLILFWLFRRAAGRGSQIFDFGRSKARKFEGESTSVGFDDVAGQDEAKQELTEVVDFLRDPQRFEEIGAKLPRGVLLAGPPGTGKTLMARAVAGEADVPFFNLSATEFVEMFVGVGASRVRDLFEKAKENQPAIVFIDELDAIGRRRGAGVGQGHDEREQTLNQLLDQMDGFEDRERVIVLAATNRPDVLDPALLRPGRFDREVTVGLPDKDGREGILRIHTKGIKLSDDVDLDSVARAAMGMSGADLANIANEAALIAAREDKTEVSAADFDAALDKVILGGGPRQTPMDEDQRRLVANHEAGHALVAWKTPKADPVRKVSIVPHGRAGGATSQLPEEKNVYQRAYLMSRLAVLLGGRVAERAVLDEISTGAESDLIQATKLARRMVTRWGMSGLGPMAYQTDSERPFLGYELTTDRELSEKTAARIDDEVEALLSERERYVEALIDEHRRDLERIVKVLLEDETMTSDELRAELGPPARESASNL